MRQLILEGRTLPVFPVHSWKAPACPRGFHSASTDPDEIEALFTRWPGPFIGVPTGAESGFDVLDIDPDGLEWWQKHRDQLPKTFTVQTPRGGLHLYFWHEPGLRCSASRLARGVDVRADGGFVV